MGRFRKWDHGFVRAIGCFACQGAAARDASNEGCERLVLFLANIEEFFIGIEPVSRPLLLMDAFQRCPHSGGVVLQLLDVSLLRGGEVEPNPTGGSGKVLGVVLLLLPFGGCEIAGVDEHGCCFSVIKEAPVAFDAHEGFERR